MTGSSNCSIAGNLSGSNGQRGLGLELQRLQKGDPTASFERERVALHRLSDLNAPVPEIVAEGADYFAIADCGTNLHQMLKAPNAENTSNPEIFAKAGRALARLHQAGVSHGRPSLRDICWDGQKIRFIDFERFAEKRNTLRGHAEDVIILLLNAFSITLEPRPEIAAVIEGYRSEDPGGVWEAAQRRAHKLRWINWLSKPVQFKKRGAREFKAIPYTLRALASPPA